MGADVSMDDALLRSALVGENIAFMRWPDWAGVGERRWKTTPGEQVQPAKTVWDVLQLLIVPLVLAVIALAFNAAETSRDRSRQDRQTREDRALALYAREDTTLDDYLKQMSSLMLDRHLVGASSTSPVADVARTLTLAAVRRLDGKRKAEIVQFLSEAKLINAARPKAVQPAVVGLRGADLRGTDLRGAYLSGVSLDGADLRGARFDGARLLTDSFVQTDLRSASFRNAFVLARIMWSNLSGADFDDAVISGVGAKAIRIYAPSSFEGSCLDNASFADAALDRVDFLTVSGRGVDFSNAKLADVYDTGRDTLVDARLNGAHGVPSLWSAHAKTSEKSDPCSNLYGSVPGIGLTLETG